MLPVATVLAVSTIALVAVSLVTRPPSDDILAKFFTPGSGQDETMSDASGLPD
jgi:hypothetical protein